MRDLASFLGVAAVLLTARASLADHYVVPSGSMEPTVLVGDHVVVNKLAYGLRVPVVDAYVASFDPPARGDVVVLASPEDGRTLLKRVIAVGGDEVRVEGGRLEINGARVPTEQRGGETYEALGDGEHAVHLDFGGGPDFGPARVPADHLLVMGDNRGNSHDGRDFGFVPRASVRGRAIAVCWRPGTGHVVDWLPLSAPSR